MRIDKEYRFTLDHVNPICFNFYEKRYEFAQKEGISVEEALEIFGVWNRYEIRLSQAKAQS